jgi:hydrogenase maturation protease
MSKKTTVVIGIGNADRGDDAIGLLVARRLRERLHPDVLVHESTGDPADLMARWGSGLRVIAVDAIIIGSEVGTIHVIDACEINSSSAMFRSQSTHAFGLAEAVALARALGTLPSEFAIVGIEAQSFGVGDELSPPVASALAGAVQAVERLLVSEQDSKQEKIHA